MIKKKEIQKIAAQLQPKIEGNKGSAPDDKVLTVKPLPKNTLDPVELEKKTKKKNRGKHKKQAILEKNKSGIEELSDERDKRQTSKNAGQPGGSDRGIKWPWNWF